MKINKLPLLLVIALTAVWASCKKEESGSGDTSGPVNTGFVLSAPSCLVTQVTSAAFGLSNTYTYDSQKRLVLIRYSESRKTAYTYSGNLMLEDQMETDGSGNTVHQVIPHYLNQSAMIERSVVGDSTSSFYIENLYSYDQNGYLKRSLEVRHYGSTMLYSGFSYGYSQGNKTTEYLLNMNADGTVADSSVKSTYTYYLEYPGKIEAWNAWNVRTGRASTHEMKSETSGGYSSGFAFEFGSNNCPSVYLVNNNSGSFSIALNWTCN